MLLECVASTKNQILFHQKNLFIFLPKFLGPFCIHSQSLISLQIQIVLALLIQFLENILCYCCLLDLVLFDVGSRESLTKSTCTEFDKLYKWGQLFC